MAGEGTPAAHPGPAEPAVLLEVSQVPELPVPEPGHEARMYAVVTVTVRRPAVRAVRAAPTDPAVRAVPSAPTDPAVPSAPTAPTAPAAPTAPTAPSARSAAVQGQGPRHAVVFLIDHSSSMVNPPTRMAAARNAAAAAVHAVPDGAYFAVVAGRDRPATVYPEQPGGHRTLAVADDVTRRAAEDALRACHPGGGTAIGSWLGRARELFAGLPGGGADFVRHALLLTDGRNEPGYESRDELAAVVAACTGQFTCDAIGIGDGWDTGELLLITTGLNGTAHAFEETDPTGPLPARLHDLTRQAAERDLTGLRLRLYRSDNAELRSFAQVHPTRRTLRPVEETEFLREFATEPWGDETRSYLLSLSARHTAGAEGAELMLTEVELVRDGAARPPVRLPPSRPVVVRWSGDHGLYSRVHPDVGHFLHQEDLVRYFEEGCAALRAHDPGTARRALGRAWQLAVEVGDDAMREHLEKMVEPRADGEVELHARIRRFDIETARIRTSYTTSHR
ncbi:VWA domain-containing protein [Streptomyces sp. NPDC090052]|uniref:VWA domain-containing protein n=1 Tax=Streptomyces sp. NPDC090052 TaxID=3365931 RepID=UPI00380BA9CB